MRNVDRDVLREAIQLADLQDLFTPTFETDVRDLLAGANERFRVLETLAFGRIIIKLVRLVAVLMRLIPSPWTIAVLIGLAAIEQLLESDDLEGAIEALNKLWDEMGGSTLLNAIAGALAVLKENGQQIVDMTDQVLRPGLTNLADTGDRIYNQYYTEGVFVRVESLVQTLPQVLDGAQADDWRVVHEYLLYVAREVQGLSNLASNLRAIMLPEIERIPLLIEKINEAIEHPLATSKV